ncbi:MAG: hypothetical protein ACFFC7_21180 [Candidatus Hermodarchaeota archaeon]
MKTKVLVVILVIVFFDVLPVLTWSQPTLAANFAIFNKQKSCSTLINPLIQDKRAAFFYGSLWQTSGMDIGQSVVVDRNTYVYTIGTSAPEESGSNLVLVKWDDQGNQLWNRSWGGSEAANGEGIAINDEGSIYTVGSKVTLGSDSGTDLVLVKWDTEGYQLWNQTWDGSPYDLGLNLAIDTDGSIYTVGSIETVTGSDLLLVKWNAEGHQLWNQSWDVALFDAGWDLAIDTDGSIYTVGSMGNSDMMLVKWNTTGTQIWNRTWDYCFGHGIAISNTNDIYTVGARGHGSYDLVVVKWNTTGTQIWNRTLDNCLGSDVAVSDTNYIYTVGTRDYPTSPHLVLVKWDATGKFLGIKTWETSSQGFGVSVDTNENIYCVGYSMETSVTDKDLLLVVFTPYGFTSDLSTKITPGLAIPVLIISTFLFLVIIRKRRKTENQS